MHRLTYEEAFADAQAAFKDAVSAVQPAHLIQSTVQMNDNVLSIKGMKFSLTQPCYVVGFGKAVLDMALSIEEKLGAFMKRSIISVPVGTLSSHPLPGSSQIEVWEGAENNLPDEVAEKTASKILNLVKSLKEDDTLIVLISGGGSALLPLPLPPLTLSEKLQVIKLLANAGADILQLNCVRKHLSAVKGGRLGAAAQPATVVSLILSDIIGDPIDCIASGPTVLNSDTQSAAWKVISDFNLQDRIPKSAQVALTSNHEDITGFQNTNVYNILLGNNTIAVSAAKTKMLSLNYSVCVLSETIQGNVVSVAEFYSQLASEVCRVLPLGFGVTLDRLEVDKQLLLPGVEADIFKAINDFCHNKRGICFIAGGETTVKVTGQGKGGRNQELALRFAGALQSLKEKYEFMDQFNISLLSAGTDGIDGPTDAAGAFGYAEQLDEDTNYKMYLNNNDSHSYYSKLDGGKSLIVTGHTGTNVMDIHILIIQRKSF